MANANIPNSIQQSTPVSAPPVEQNFRYIEDFLNTEVAHADGTVPFASLPAGPSGAVPVSAAQLTPKGYVDRRAPRMLGFRSQSSQGLHVTSATPKDMAVDFRFTMPDLVSGQYLRFWFMVPRIRLISVGGTPGAGVSIRLEMRVGSKVVCMGQTAVSNLAGLTPENQPSLFGERIVNSPSELGAVGTQVTVKAFGSIPHHTKGGWQPLGTTDHPYQFGVEVI